MTFVLRIIPTRRNCESIIARQTLIICTSSGNRQLTNTHDITPRYQPVLNWQQEMLLPPCVDEYVSQNNPVRAIDEYVVNNGTVKKVEVKTGLRDEHSTELLNSSIKEADTIVRPRERISQRRRECAG